MVKRSEASAWASFGRAQIANLLTTAADYGTFFTLVEVCKVWYVPSRAISAVAGGVTNFLLGRYWSFKADHERSGPQAVRYLIVSAGSLLLNVGGVYFFTEFVGLKYGYSAIGASLIVSLGFNFPLQRYYVFR